MTPTTTNPQDSIPPHFLPPDCTPDTWRRSVLAMWTRARRYDWSIPDAVLDRMRDVLLGRVSLEPIKMILHCPACGKQHIDEPEPEEVVCNPIGVIEAWTNPPHRSHGAWNMAAVKGVWTNPPHRSHLCNGCGHIWRPADVPTTGVREIVTRGNADTWPRACLTTRAPL